MNKRTIAIFAGAAIASTKYFYLSSDLNSDVSLSKGEFAALQLTAYYNNTGSLTSRLVRQSVRAMLGPMSLDVLVDTFVQESWPVHKGGTEFSISDAELMLAYMEAGEVVLGWVGRYFPDISTRAVNIIFTIKGFKLGVYQQGKFTIQK
jgi:hypothetical protein